MLAKWYDCVRLVVLLVLLKCARPKVDLLADIVTNSKLAPEHIEAERSVILQEKEHVEAQPEEVLFDYLHAAAFQGSPLGRTILGPERNIKVSVIIALFASLVRSSTFAVHRSNRVA